MSERFIYPRKDSSWAPQLLYWGALAVAGCGLKFGPPALKRPSEICFMVVLGIGAFAGDRWGLTKSSSRAERILGRTIMVVFAAAMFLGAYFVLIGK